MAVTGIGISASEKDSSSYGSYAIRPGTSTDALYIKWHTLYAESQKYANVAVAWRAVKRGDVPGGEGYGDWERSEADASQVAWYWRRFPVSELWHSEADLDGPGYWWAAPLDFTSQDGSTVTHKSIAERLFAGDYSFTGRSYDAIEMLVKVRMEYEEDGQTVSAPLAQATLYVGYIPEYHATGARVTKEGLVVAYTSPGWERSSDRWCADVGVSSSGGKVVAAGTWGGLRRHGELLVPSSQMLRDPYGEELSGTVRFNATWRPSGMPFASMSLAGIVLADTRTANTPTLRATAMPDGTVLVDVGDSGDRGVPLAKATVRLVGGAYKDLDEAEVDVPGQHVFRFPPLGVQTSWEAVGVSGSGAVSKPARATCRTSNARQVTTYECLDGSAKVRARYDFTPKWTGEQESELVKLAGRARETAGYGEGGSLRRDATFTAFTRPVCGVETVDVSDLDALAFAGGAMLRGPGGTRVKLHIESVDYERRDEAAFILSVSVSAKEVS